MFSDKDSGRILNSNAKAHGQIDAVWETHTTKGHLQIEVASVTKTKEMRHLSLLPSHPIVPKSLLPSPPYNMSFKAIKCPRGKGLPQIMSGAGREKSRGAICLQILFP